MRLSPIYLVAPEPTGPSMSTRRAFLLAGSTFAVGLSFGGACGYAVGVGKSGEGASSGGGGEPPPPATEELKPSGDVELDELRRLAVKAPIEELVQQRLVFVNATFMDYPKDRILWQGVERLCGYVLNGGAVESRAQFGKALAGVIERADPSLTAHLLQFVEPLRKLK